MQHFARALGFLRPVSHDNDYLEITEDILFNTEVQKLAQFTHHKNSNRLTHSINVSYISYKVCKKLNLDAVSAARGGLLHDFFLYDWRTVQLPEGSKSHPIEHPRQALKTAKKHFVINEIEQNIIARHMWPMTIIPPKYMESFIVMMVDKYCAVFEVLNKDVIQTLQSEEVFVSFLENLPSAIKLNANIVLAQENIA